jgi:enoyl-CoA hydratase/carnithine racemase
VHEPTPPPAKTLAIDRTADRWIVTLDRPGKANALCADVVEALIEAVAQAAAAGVPVLAFRGNGRNFSAGFDFTDLESQGEGELCLRFVRLEMLLQSIVRSPCLTVAFAQGRNFGAGVDLFAACKWRIAAPDATFRMPGLAFGLVLGTRRFAALVGGEWAREILEGLETFDAASARHRGFVRDVTAQEGWEGVLEEAIRVAACLPAASRAELYRTLEADTLDADLADLVRSAARPGLKDRIAAYLAAQRRNA